MKIIILSLPRGSEKLSDSSKFAQQESAGAGLDAAGACCPQPTCEMPASVRHCSAVPGSSSRPPDIGPRVELITDLGDFSSVTATFSPYQLPSSRVPVGAVRRDVASLAACPSPLPGRASHSFLSFTASGFRCLRPLGFQGAPFCASEDLGG